MLAASAVDRKPSMIRTLTPKALVLGFLAGALAGLAATVHDIVLYYPNTDVAFWMVYAVATVASGALVAGIGSWLLIRALLPTGVLAPFAVGREQREV